MTNKLIKSNCIATSLTITLIIIVPAVISQLASLTVIDEKSSDEQKCETKSCSFDVFSASNSDILTDFTLALRLNIKKCITSASNLTENFSCDQVICGFKCVGIANNLVSI